MNTKTQEHIAKINRQMLRRDPSLLEQGVMWPKTPERQLAHALGKLGPPPYPQEVQKFLSAIREKCK